MSLQDHDAARRRKVRALDAPLSTSHPDQVLTFFDWCRLNQLSERTGRRILANGTGPDVVKLSTHRIGITVGANQRWQASRKRA